MSINVDTDQTPVELNETARAYPADKTIDGLFSEQARRTPHAAALVSGDREVTYGELDAMSEAVARGLRRAGVTSEERVGVLCDRSVELVAALLGVLKASCAYVPLEGDYPAERIRYLLADAGVRVVVTREAETSRGELQGLTLLTVEGAFAGEEGEGEAGAGTAEGTGSPTHAEGSGSPTGEGPRSSEGLAYVIYTSGSTGRPKGVMVTHRNVLRLAVNPSYLPDFAPADLGAQLRFLLLAPASFDASTFELWVPLLSGHALVVAPPGRLSLHDLGGLVSSSRVDALWLTAGLFHLAAEHCLGELRGLKYLLAGGDVLSPRRVREALDALPGAWVINGYGPTENTTFTCCHPMRGGEGEDKGKAHGVEFGGSVPVGRPVGSTRVYVLDGRGRPCAVGEVGELYAGGDGVARGYAGRAGLTAERFVPDAYSGVAGGRLYRTGDLVRLLSDGRVEFVGRRDGQVKVRGFRVEVGEVEAALGQHESVRECVVVARDEEAGKRLVAYVVPSAVDGARPGELHAYLRRLLPDYMVPSSFVLLDELPLTRNGKVDRARLASSEAGVGGAVRGDGRGASDAPRGAVEEMVGGIWEEVLGVEGVGRGENFFELGGHSLIATQVIARVREVFGLELPLRAMWETPHLAGLAEMVEAGRGAGQREHFEPIQPIPRDGELPLSFAQERVWFLDQLAPGNKSYQFQATLSLKGRLDVAALERSLQEIVGRHEILRTTFHSDGWKPSLTIHPFRPESLPLVDLSRFAPAEREGEFARVLGAEFEKSFDLTRLPLVRWTLVRLSEEEHVLVHVEHHIIHDGWSFNVFLRELSETYRAFNEGRTPGLPELPVQFADFAHWQHLWMEQEAAEAQLSYWKEKLADIPLALELPADRPRPVVQSFRGAALRRELAPRLCEEVGALSRRAGATPFMTLFAAFAGLLHRYTGQADICVGSSVANRRRRETESMLGMILNNLVLRTDLSGDPAFGELLARVKGVTLEAYANQDLPYDKVVEVLHPERDLSINPLFQVMFNFHNSPLRELDFGGLKATQTVGLSNGSAKFDLNLIVLPTPVESGATNPRPAAGGLTVIWEYNSDLFDPATIERMAAHYERLLRSVVADPRQHLSRLPLLGDEERRRLLVEWNDTAREYPTDKTIDGMFVEQVQRTPDAVAVVSGEREVSYAELDAMSEAVARRLRRAGVKQGEPVGVLCERKVELVAALLGVLKAGGAYVPLEGSYPAERIRYMAADAGARVVVTQEPERGREELEGLTLLTVEEACAPGAEGEAGGAAGSHARAGLRGGGDVAYFIYTSGSTGRPKGVMISHRSAVNFIHWGREAFTPHELSGVLAATSISFDLSVFELFVTLSWGGTVILVNNVLDVPALQQSREVTLVNTVPSAMTELLALDALPASVRVVNLAGEALHNKLVLNIYERPHVERVLNLYGPSEDTTYSTYAVMQKGARGIPPIGRPVANTQAYVLDSHFEPVPVGAIGELYLGGDGLAYGYVGRPGLTAERFLPDPFSGLPGARLYRTGDLARYLPDGNLEYHGRVDHQVKVRGYRIELGEIEAALSRHDTVRECVVVARDEDGDKRLVAYVVPSAAGAADAEELHAHLKRQLPDYMVPSALMTLEELPLTPNGKVNRRALPAPDPIRPEQSAEFAAPPTLIGKRLADIWAEVLRLERVGAGDNFFRLGGHSLMAMQVIARSRAAFRIDLPVRSIFEAPTLGEFAEVVEERLIEKIEELTDEEAQQWFGD